MVCVDLSNHLTYMLYWIKVLQRISLILKSKIAGIYAQSLTEIQDLINHNSTENCETWLFQNFLGLFIFLKLSRPGNCCFKIPWLLQVFHDRMNPECDDRVRVGCDYLNQNKYRCGRLAGGSCIWSCGFEWCFSSSAHHYYTCNLARSSDIKQYQNCVTLWNRIGYRPMKR